MKRAAPYKSPMQLGTELSTFLSTLVILHALHLYGLIINKYIKLMKVNRHMKMRAVIK